MRVENRSAFHSTSKLRALADIVDDLVKEVADVKFMFEDLADPQRHVGGITIQQGIIIVVVIGLSRSCQDFPFASRHAMPEVAEIVGPVVFDSWLEEVLFVMLHEARHVRQFRRLQFKERQKALAEVDAEKFAKRALAKWRRTQSVLADGTYFAEAFAI